MRQFLGHLIVLATVTFLIGYYTSFPWWSFAPIAVLTGIIFGGNGFSKFMAAILAVGGVWGTYAYYIQLKEVGALVPKVALLLTVPDGNPMMLVAITAGLGAFIAGLSVLTGHSFIQIFKRKREDNVLRRR